MELLLEGHPEAPLHDLALTHALLREVAAGWRGPTARIFGPGPTLAFGRRDRLEPGFGRAAAAGREHGFVTALRLGGGRVVAYDPGSVQLDLVLPEGGSIEERFVLGTALLREALEAVGARPEIGELEGEYCPGRWSLHADGVKLAGSAQRVIRGAALLTAVVPVQGGRRLREVLIAVQEALDLPWRPSTAGALEDAVPGITGREVVAALTAALGARFAVRPGRLGEATVRAAQALEERHAVS